MKGRDPDRGGPETDKIIEAPLYPAEVAYAVVIAVLKGPRVDLIDHTGLPPERRHANQALGACADCRLLITWLRSELTATLLALAHESLRTIT
jgi:hypothetical protein